MWWEIQRTLECCLSRLEILCCWSVHILILAVPVIPDISSILFQDGILIRNCVNIFLLE